MAPSLLNIAITVFKDTSVLVVVAVPEITYTGRIIHISHPANYALVLFLIILIYWSIASAGTFISAWMEKKWPVNFY